MEGNCFISLSQTRAETFMPVAAIEIYLLRKCSKVQNLYIYVRSYFKKVLEVL